MKKNMGSADRVIRVMLAVLVAVLYFTNVISGTTAIILAVLAIVFVATSLMSFCPLYLPFGLSTLRKKMNAKG
jgi:fatty acid desaturase